MRLLIFGAAIALAAAIHQPALASCDPQAAKALYVQATAQETVPGVGGPTTTVVKSPPVAELPARAALLERAAAGYQECAAGAVRVPAELAAMGALVTAANYYNLGSAPPERGIADLRTARKLAIAISRDPAADDRAKASAQRELDATMMLRERGE